MTAGGSLRRFVLDAALLLLFGSNLLASTIRQLSFSEMVGSCQLVFEGRVASVEARAIGNLGRIDSFVTFEVLDLVKGAYSGRTLELSFLGGAIGNRTLAVSDLHIPQPGEHGIYFVRSTKETMVNPLCGWDQGHFLIVRDEQSVQRVAARSGRRVLSVSDDATANPANGISEGTALGVETSRERATGGLTVNEFKREIRRMLGAAR
jgi:hypothetical protein